MSAPAILETRDLTIRFGGVTAVDKVSISIRQGYIFGLIGPNGAGKTTMFNLLTKIYNPTEGSIIYKGKDITGLKTHEITPLGIARTFQNIRLLKEHTVYENILLATHHHVKYPFLAAFFKTGKYRAEERRAIELVDELLVKYEMGHLRNEIATDLPQGLQRKVEIVRALATGAELIFLDEPAAGLNPVETNELMRLITELKGRGYTVFLIEHDMKLVKGICDEVAVLHFGKLLDHGSYEQVTRNPEVIQAYLGRRHENAQNH